MRLIVIFRFIENKIYIIYNKMINICVYCNPNYDNNNRIQTNNRNIDLVSQLIILYKSIKKNWNNFEYDFYCFHNKNILWSDEDKKRISEFKDLNLISVDYPDHNNVPWQTRIPCFIYPLKNKGTHRLVLDCDMIALKNPEFDFNVDWQCTFAGSLINDKYINYMLKKYNFDLDHILNKNYIKKNLLQNYYNNPNSWKNIYPYFNAGAVLIKEKLTNKLISHWKPTYDLVLEKSWPSNLNNKDIRHISGQYTLTFSLLATSNNWKPFKPGFNYLIKSYDIKKFKKKNISLVHYCGINAEDIAKKEFKEYIF